MVDTRDGRSADVAVLRGRYAVTAGTTTQARREIDRYEFVGRSPSRPMSKLHGPQPGPVALRTEHDLEVSSRKRSWRWERARFQLHVSWPRFVVQEVLAIAIVIAMLLATTRHFPTWCLWLFVLHVGYYATMLVRRCGRAPASPTPPHWVAGDPRVAHGRIELRHPNPGDHRDLSRTVDRTVSRTMGFRRLDTRAVKLLPRHQFAVRERAYFAVYRLDDARAAGAVTFYDFGDGDRTATIGLWLGPSQRGQRLGSDALAAAAQLGWSLGLTTVRVGTAVDNTAMLRILESLGATLVDERPHRLPNRSLVASRWYELRNPGFFAGS